MLALSCKTFYPNHSALGRWRTHVRISLQKMVKLGLRPKGCTGELNPLSTSGGRMSNLGMTYVLVVSIRGFLHPALRTIFASAVHFSHVLGLLLLQLYTVTHCENRLQFMNAKRMRKPTNVSETTKRIMHNAYEFKANYIFIMGVLALYSVLYVPQIQEDFQQMTSEACVASVHWCNFAPTGANLMLQRVTFIVRHVQIYHASKREKCAASKP
jgi:hypothetical protein